ncbi:MAG: pyruvate kinase alpha/beta domain-containing protein [bacterium]
MEVVVKYFEEKGEINTEATLVVARRRLEELGIKQVVVASTYGDTARKAIDVFENLDINLVIVTISYGFTREGWIMKEEVRKELESRGVKVLTSVHALGDDVSSSFSSKFGGHNPNEIVAEVLRMFSQGMKVAVETTIMAVEAGLIDVNQETIAIGGTDRGADTAIVVKPSYARDFLSFQIREVLAKPR